MNDASDSYKRLAQLSPEEKRALLAKLLHEKAQAAANKDWSALSHGQRALWFLYRLAPQSPAYNLLYAARIRSALDLSALQRAVQALVRRYPILTASYGTRDGEPVQRVHPDAAIPVEVVDAASWDEEELKKQVSAEGHRPFDLEKGPVLRLKLFTHGAQDAVLALGAHHIAVDFWALDILVEELGLLYIAELLGEPAALPPVGTQHDDYVKWQAAMLNGPEGERLWDYWRHELAGELPLLNLPLDHPRPPVQTYGGATYSFPIEEQIAKRLRELANGERATLYTILLAAFQVLLYRYSQQESLLLGTTALGRNRPGLERVIGYLANPVVLRADFSGSPTFRDFLRGVREKVLGALEHQDFPFPLLVERLQPRRDPSYSPLFQVLFIWDKMRGYEEQDSTAFARSGLHLEPFLFGQLGAPFDLSLTIFEMVSGLTADFHYNVDLFEAATIERLGRHFHILLSGIAANPDQSLLDLPLLTPEEQRTMLVEWNATQQPYPAQVTLHQLIEEQVARTPGVLAVSFEGQTLTYDELNRRANQLAHALHHAGVTVESRVGVCMERSLEMVIALLAVLKSGGAYVPLDPGYPQERLAYMLEDAQVPVLLTQTAVQAQLPHTDVITICLDTFWDGGRDEPETNPQVAMQPDNLAYMIYTSGSTGKPKGVMNTHRGVVNRLHWMQQTYQLTAADRVMQKTPFSFDVSVWEFFWPLLSGARLVVARPGGHQDTHYLASLISEQQITTMHFVPSMLQAFLLEDDLEERCRSLKRVFCSGEALSFDLQERFFARFPRVALHNLYGPTEAAIDVTYWECQRGSQETTVPIGRPIANTQIYLLDAAMHPVPIGVPGELYIGGVGVARGYFRRPELTRERFIADPFSDQSGARLFKTGDLARYRADGAIEFLGRIDHQVKIRGFRIELEEIEAVLAQHPAVKEVVVTAREDTPGNRRLVAYIVPATGAGTTQMAMLSPQEAGIAVEDLRAFLKEHLPYYMVPAAFLFLTALPLTPNGKLDRKALPAPDSVRPDLQSDFVAPRTPLETQLADIWMHVLGLNKVGVHDNFFDLGGASIQSLEIIAKAKEAGIPLALEMLFEFQTIAELAEAIKQRQANSVVPEEQAEQKAAAVQQQSPADKAVTAPVSAHEQPGVNALGNTYIESLGVYLPPKIVSTDDIVKGCAKPIRFPLARLTGIKYRRMAGDTEFSIDLAKKAIADCLANSKYNPEDIDMLVCGNISRYNHPNQGFDFEPGTAVQLKHYFGFKNAIVFDLDNACTGLFTAAYIIDSFIQAGIIRRGIAVSGEYISHILVTAQQELEGFMDSRLPCLTVGDAGAAMLLERAPDKKVGFHEFELFTLGRYSEDCIGKLSDNEFGAIMYTDAVRVSAVNMTHAVAHAATMIKRSGWPLDAFKHVIPHQTSNTTIRDAARAINDYFGAEVCTQENVINNIAERANTATTTQMVAVMDHIRSGRIQSGDNAVFGITGSGATIGAALYTFDDLPDRIRRREAGEYTPAKVVPEPHPIAPVSLPGQRFRIASIGIAPADVEPSTLDLLQAAAENCLAASSYQRGDIDLLMFAGVYRDDFLSEPAVASLLAGKLRINDDIESPTDKKTFALDIFNGAVGTLNACYAAMGMMRAGRFKNALVTASEVENNRERHPEMLLGIEETGSALLLDASPDGQTGFGNFVFKYATDYLDAYRVQIHRYNGRIALNIQKDARIENCYLACIQEAVQELLRLEQLDMSNIKLVLPPQFSSEFISRLGDTLGIERTKLVDAQAKHDPFTSSLAYTLRHVQERGLAQPGDIGLIVSAGSGIQVGCAIYYF
jgi:amino acid adenylation domain-containing protein